MQVALRTVVPVGLVRWPDAPSSFSVVVKVTFDANDSGAPSSVSESHAALCEGERDPRGFMLEPTDFLKIKRACDVVLLDSSLSSARPVRVRVDRIDASLGPAMTALAPDGACAPPDQRIPIPTLPLRILLEYPGRRCVATIAPPAPTASVLTHGQPRAVPIMLKADTVYVHPWQARVSVVFRGSFQYQGDIDRDATLLVDVTGRMSQTPQREASKWPQRSAIESELPIFVPDPAAFEEESSDGLVPQTTLEMQAPPAEYDPSAAAPVAPAPVTNVRETQPAVELAPQPTLDMVVTPEHRAALEGRDLVPQTTMTMAAIPADSGPLPTLQIALGGGAPVAAPASGYAQPQPAPPYANAMGAAPSSHPPASYGYGAPPSYGYPPSSYPRAPEPPPAPAAWAPTFGPHPLAAQPVAPPTPAAYVVPAPQDPRATDPIDRRPAPTQPIRHEEITADIPPRR